MRLSIATTARRSSSSVSPRPSSAWSGLKDVDLALSAGKRHNVPLPLASLLHDVLLEAIAHGDGESDWTALAKVALSRSGQI